MGAPLPVDGGITPLSTRRIALGVPQVLFVTAPEGDYQRLFMVQRTGAIRIYDMVSGTMLPTPFLNIASLLETGFNEQGLLGLAFHPDYATNGFFYVNYTSSAGGQTRVARYSVSAGNPNVANPASASILLTQAQFAANHNGGMLAFGPDGYLYIGLGDGGSGNDPQGNGQNINTQLGKLLRIDVDGAAPFTSPPDNPFVGVAGLDQIWAYGLRNPWRFSFDRVTGDLYIADVGQNAWEEIDFQPASSLGGENYGWRCMEGNSCTGLTGCTCNSPTLTDPILAYSHAGGACSVTGGYVYRGCAMPDMHGLYFYAEFCANTIFSFEYDGVSPVAPAPTNRTSELVPPPGNGGISSISSFGEDAYGEMYICDLNGEVFKIVPADIDQQDCDGNFVVDACEIAVGAVVDCNGNGLSDICDITSGADTDCDGNGVPDSCEVPTADCNGNGILDACDIAGGTETDCNANGIPDACEIAAFDCNANGQHDSCEIDAGTAGDCDGNDVPDECQIATSDCNNNGILDACDIGAGQSIDCDLDETPDECQIAAGTSEDCNGNQLLDACDIDLGLAIDCDFDGRIDSCQISEGSAPDCNANGAIDSCDIATGGSEDLDGNGVPDECEATEFIRSDCNADGAVDLADPIRALGGLFGGVGVPACNDACDSNDDGSVDLADPIHTLTWLFSSGPDPDAPFPACGTDPTDDLLPCDEFDGCP